MTLNCVKVCQPWWEDRTCTATHKKLPMDKSHIVKQDSIYYIPFWQRSDAKETYNGISIVTLEGCYNGFIRNPVEMSLGSFSFWMHDGYI